MHELSHNVPQLGGSLIQVRVDWKNLLVFVEVVSKMGPPTLALILREIASLMITRVPPHGDTLGGLG